MAINDISLTAGMRNNLLALQGTAAALTQTQDRLSSGKKVNSALDNPTNFFSAQSHLQRASDLGDRKDGMSEGIQTVKAANAGITSITSLIQAAKGLASSALGTTDVAARKSYQDQFNTLRKQIDDLATDSGYKGTNLLKGATLTVQFNEKTDAATLSIAGFDASTAATGLNIQAPSSSSTVSVESAAAATAAGTALTDAATQLSDIKASYVQAGVVKTALAAANASMTSLKVATDAEKAVDDGLAAAAGFMAGLPAAASAPNGDTVQGFADAARAYAETTLKTGTGTNPDSESYDFFIAAADTLDQAAIRIAAGTILQADLDAVNDEAATGAGAFGDYDVTTSVAGVAGAAAAATADAAAAAITTFLAANTTVAGENGTAEGFFNDSVTSLGNYANAMDTTPNSTTLSTQIGFATTASTTTSNAYAFDTTQLSADASLAAATAITDATAATAAGDTLVAAGLTLAATDLTKAAGALTALDGKSLATYNTVIGTAATTASTAATTASTLISAAATGDAGWDGAAGSAAISASSTQLDNALTTLRTQSSSLAANLSVVTTRQDFTSNMISTLTQGADNLTLADMNQEGANMLMLQTRQSLSTTALSLSSQAAQSILKLF